MPESEINQYLEIKSFKDIIEEQFENAKLANRQSLSEDLFQLIQAIVKDDPLEVAKILQTSHIDLNKMLSSGMTPFILAIYKANTKIVTQFLQLPSIDINQCDKKGNSPLLCASLFGHLEIVQKLLKIKRININLLNEIGLSALFVAAVNGYTQIFRELLKQRNIKINQNYGYQNSTILMIICAYSFFEKQSAWRMCMDSMVQNRRRSQLSNHSSINSQFSNQENNGRLRNINKLRYSKKKTFRLIYQVEESKENKSCDNNSFSSDQFLLGAHNDFKNSTYFNIVQQLVQHTKIDLELKDEDGYTALCWACKYGFSQFVQILLEHGASINCHDNKSTNNDNYYHVCKIISLKSPFYLVINSEIDRKQKINLLLGHVCFPIDINFQIAIYSIEKQQNQIFETNLLVWSILDGFENDDADILRNVLNLASQEIYVFDLNIFELKPNMNNTNSSQPIFIPQLNIQFDTEQNINLLDLLVQNKKYYLVQTVYQGFIFGQINPNEFTNFVTCLPKLAQDENFHETLSKFLQSEHTILQNFQQQQYNQLDYVKNTNINIVVQMPLISLLQSLVEHSGDTSLFSTLIISTAVTRIWRRLGVWYFRVNFTIYIILTILSVMLAVLQLRWKIYKDDFDYENQIFIILFLMFSIAIVMLTNEILQNDFSLICRKCSSLNSCRLSFQKTLKKYYKRTLNQYLQGFAHFSDIAIIFINLLLPFIWGDESGVFDVLIAVYLILIGMRLIFWLLPMQFYGHYIITMILIMLETRLLFVLLGILLLFFSAAFLVLNLTQEPNNFSYLFFQMLLGLFGNINIDKFRYGESPQQEVGAILFIIFIVTIPILTMNFLIALMTQAYEHLAHQKESVFFRNQAIISLEGNQVFRNLKCIFTCVSQDQSQLDQITINYQGEHQSNGGGNKNNNLLFSTSQSPKKSQMMEDLFAEIQELKKEIRQMGHSSLKLNNEKQEFVSSKRRSDSHINNY